MCSPQPTAFAPTETTSYIAKWRNIPSSDYSKISGVIVGENVKRIKNEKQRKVAIEELNYIKEVLKAGVEKNVQD